MWSFSLPSVNYRTDLGLSIFTSKPFQTLTALLSCHSHPRNRLVGSTGMRLLQGISKLNWQGSAAGDSSPAGGSPMGHSPSHSFVAAEPAIQLADRSSSAGAPSVW